VIAEVYLICLKCRRIPEWTKVRVETKDGKAVKNYEFEGLCPFCDGDKFEVVEVRSKDE
jgi:Zn finger protein HypA/HybF involved in hydrogenase expression